MICANCPAHAMLLAENIYVEEVTLCSHYSSTPPFLIVLTILLVAIIFRLVASDEEKHKNEYSSWSAPQLSLRAYLLQFAVAALLMFVVFVFIYNCVSRMVAQLVCV
jgi:uncharacterized BrkB/YihY/UPF0761 family membrane protein